MKLLTEIKLQKTDDVAPQTGPQWKETRGVVAAVHHELRPGYFVHVTLGSAGLQIFRGSDCVAIPLSTLIEMAGEANALFKPHK
jgi:hypothetical protein